MLSELQRDLGIPFSDEEDVRDVGLGNTYATPIDQKPYTYRNGGQDEGLARNISSLGLTDDTFSGSILKQRDDSPNRRPPLPRPVSRGSMRSRHGSGPSRDESASPGPQFQQFNTHGSSETFITKSESMLIECDSFGENASYNNSNDQENEVFDEPDAKLEVEENNNYAIKVESVYAAAADEGQVFAVPNYDKQADAHQTFGTSIDSYQSDLDKRSEGQKSDIGQRSEGHLSDIDFDKKSELTVDEDMQSLHSNFDHNDGESMSQHGSNKSFPHNNIDYGSTKPKSRHSSRHSSKRSTPQVSLVDLKKASRSSSKRSTPNNSAVNLQDDMLGSNKSSPRNSVDLGLENSESQHSSQHGSNRSTPQGSAVDLHKAASGAGSKRSTPASSLVDLQEDNASPRNSIHLGSTYIKPTSHDGSNKSTPRNSIDMAKPRSHDGSNQSTPRNSIDLGERKSPVGLEVSSQQDSINHDDPPCSVDYKDKKLMPVGSIDNDDDLSQVRDKKLTPGHSVDYGDDLTDVSESQKSEPPKPTPRKRSTVPSGGGLYNKVPSGDSLLVENIQEDESQLSTARTQESESIGISELDDDDDDF